MKKRLDQHLVDEGLAPSKTKAQEMIEAGQVMLNHSKCIKPSQKVESTQVEVQIAISNLLKYVSRSGFKLEAALKKVQLDVKGFRALDVGQSTGGFTDCLLQHGAQEVVGVDVAKNELAESLAKDKRVVLHTGVNARDLSKFKGLSKEKFNLIVVDVSFISLEKILPETYHFLLPRAKLLALVKPQFEVGRVNLDKRGLVKSDKAVMEVEKRMLKMANDLGLIRLQYFAAEMKGRDGNQEYFLYAQKK